LVARLVKKALSTRTMALKSECKNMQRLLDKSNAFMVLNSMQELHYEDKRRSRAANPRGLPAAITRTVAFQQRGSGRPLDDVVVPAINADGSPAALEIQAKRKL
jgi:hypothetical protein